MSMRDQHGIVADWLVKLAIGFAVIGVVGYDAGSILVNYFTLGSGATDVAVAVSSTVDNAGPASSYTPDEIRNLALAVVNSEDRGVEGAKVLKVGTDVDQAGVVHIRLRRVADTLVVKRISAIAKWARATADGQAGTT